jgi:hypothetical protein
VPHGTRFLLRLPRRQRLKVNFGARSERAPFNGEPLRCWWRYGRFPRNLGIIHGFASSMASHRDAAFFTSGAIRLRDCWKNIHQQWPWPPAFGVRRFPQIVDQASGKMKPNLRVGA